ncbi:DUF4256 domain-containing protein [Mucilaginibacter sp. UC70_90]
MKTNTANCKSLESLIPKPQAGSKHRPISGSSAGPSSPDYRYGTIFIYHNGAESYYAARGFRGALRV